MMAILAGNAIRWEGTISKDLCRQQDSRRGMVIKSLSIIYIDISVVIAMGGGIAEPNEKDEETICSRTAQARQNPKVTGEPGITCILQWYV